MILLKAGFVKKIAMNFKPAMVRTLLMMEHTHSRNMDMMMLCSKVPVLLMLSSSVPVII